MKLPELIQNIKSTLYNNRVPNSNLLDDRQIIYWINEVRALFLKQEYNKVRNPQNNEKQILNNVEMIVSSNELEIIDMNAKTLLRSKNKLPRTIQYILSEGIISVRGLNTLLERINFTSRENAIYKGNGIFNKNKLFAFKHNDYLWIKYGEKNDKSSVITNVMIEGVFENPLEVDVFNGTPNQIRFGLDEYPISEAFKPYIEDQILKTNIQRFIKDINSNDEEEIRQNNR